MLTIGVFLVVDFAFLAANLLKIVEGGWIADRLSLGGMLGIVVLDGDAFVQTALNVDILVMNNGEQPGAKVGTALPAPREAILEQGRLLG